LHHNASDLVQGTP